jgi:hypothetical protein
MVTITKMNNEELKELILHKNCELQFRDSPFGDGRLYFYCLDHKMFILGVENG